MTDDDREWTAEQDMALLAALRHVVGQLDPPVYVLPSIVEHLSAQLAAKVPTTFTLDPSGVDEQMTFPLP